MNKIKEILDLISEESDKIEGLAAKMHNLENNMGYFKAVRTSEHQSLSKELNNNYHEKGRLQKELVKAKIEKEVDAAEQYYDEGSDYFSKIRFNSAQEMADEIWYDKGLRSEMDTYIWQRRRSKLRTY